MKNASGREAQAFKSSPTSLSESSGSNWDVCSENSLAIDGRGAIPYETLAASGIPKDVADRLNYRNLEPSDVEAILGYPQTDCWGIKYLNADGSDVLVDGTPFVRIRRPNGSEPKYLTPKGKGNRIYFSPLLKPEVLNSGKPLMFTEGEKCCDSANHHGFACVGLAGVYSFKDKANPDGLPELKEISFQNGRQILICFDSDITTNPQVLDAGHKLAQWLCHYDSTRNAKPYFVKLPCELNGDMNGIDDFLARHGADALQRLIEIAQPAGHWVKCQDTDDEGNPVTKYRFKRLWEPEPKNPHYIAVPLSTVMKENYADNPEVGIHQWRGTHWSRLNGKRPLHPPTHHWMDRERFHTRGDGRINTIVHEAQDYLEVRQWDSPNLTAFTNGTYEAVSDVLHPGHRQEDRLTFCFPFDRDPNAKCQRFLEFLGETFKNEDGAADQKAILLLRAAIRWTVCPKDRSKPFRYERGFDVQGPRGSGKGTLAEVLQALVGGSHGAVQLRSCDYSDPNALADGIGKKIAIDTDAAGYLADVDTYNKVCSNEPVKTKILYKDIGSARLGIVPWRFYNDKPANSQANDEGMTRRVITFVIRESVKKKDYGLKEKLISEIAGIYWWAMSMPEPEMAHAFEHAGEVDSIRQATLESRLDANPWLVWLLEVFPNGLEETQASTLYGMFKRWFKEDYGGGQVMSLKALCTRLKKLIPYKMLDHRDLNGRSMYTILPITREKVEEYFDLKPGSSGFDPLPVGVSSSNPLQVIPTGTNGSGRSVEDQGGSRPLTAKAKNQSVNGFNDRISKGSGKNPLDPLPNGILTNSQLVQLALDAGCTDLDEVINWVPKYLHKKVGRRDAERALRHLKRLDD